MIQAIPVESIDNEHMAKTVYARVSEILNELGYDIDLIDTLSGDPEIHGREVGITLDMSKGCDDLIRDGRLPFTLERHLDGYFGESTGSSNVTTLKYKRDMNLKEVLNTFEKTGQLKDALELIQVLRSENDPSAETILGYAIAQYAKGWIAEKLVVDNLEGVDHNGSVSQDAGGIDFKWNGEYTQLGSITRINSKKKDMENSDRVELVYQWSPDGYLVVGHMYDILAYNKKMAKEVGLSGTLTARTHGGINVCDKVGRSFRYIWW